jgi:hypothetical protein
MSSSEKKYWREWFFFLSFYLQIFSVSEQNFRHDEGKKAAFVFNLILG